MKFLFVIHDVYQDNNHFPLGPAYLAAVLQAAGHTVSVLSQDVYHYPMEYITDYIKSWKPDMVGMGFLAARFGTVKEVCKAVKKTGTPLVLGGQGVTPIPEYVLYETGADYAVLGEGELILPELLGCSDPDDVNGIAYWCGDDVKVNKRREPVQDLDSIPFPAWDLFPMDHHTDCQFFKEKRLGRSCGIISSRGCPYSCSFCYRMEDSIRLRSVSEVVLEMGALRARYDVSVFYFLDELLTVTKKRTREFCEGVLNMGLDLKWTCNGRVNILDEETLKLMKAAGCIFINYGLESTDQEVLDLMGKHTTVEQIMDVARLTKEVGIGSGLNMIWGCPGDKLPNLYDQARVIKDFHTFDQCRTIRPVTPYPGSALYYKALEDGLLEGPGDFFDKFTNSDRLTVNFTGANEGDVYEHLYKVNSGLIDYFYGHKASEIKDGFHRLYFEGDNNFSGAR